MLLPFGFMALYAGSASAAPLPLGSQPQQVEMSSLAVSLGLLFVTTATAYLFARLRARTNAQAGLLRAEITDLRTRLDRAEALIASDSQVIVTFGGPGEEVEVSGGLDAQSGVPAGRRLLGFGSWLHARPASQVEGLVDNLRRRGEAFELSVETRRGQYVAIDGRAIGGRALLRIRSLNGERLALAELSARQSVLEEERDRLRTMLDGIPQPAWLRDGDGRLIWVNSAYARAVDAPDPQAAVAAGLEFLEQAIRDKADSAFQSGTPFRSRAAAVSAGQRQMFDVAEFPHQSGRAGLALDISELENTRIDLARRIEAHRKTLDELTTGVAIFQADGRITFHNHAFRQLWRLDPAFLAQEPTDSAIFDRLRAEEALPEPPNFRDWKAHLLEAYRVVEPREHWWHLPDGRTMRVVQTPNPEGGITYLFDDVSERIDLESRYNALTRVQRETLDNLRDGVAVFGSDGRLRLYNPAFEEMWKLPAAELDARPHAGRVFALCRILHEPPEPWDMLRTAVTAIPEGRRPASGRIERADGSSIDIATVPLPDGAAMVTFSDVTASVAMERALTDRNEALEAAAQLKNAFVKHVSYELRAPLTNIIGFAQLLADESTGPLTPRQREYSGHVLDSSAALYAIINDILDLATIDAGAMELELGFVDVRAAVDAAVEGVRGRLAESGLTLDISVPTSIGSFIADEKRLRQVLFNLLSNAIGFSPEGAPVKLSVVRGPETISFRVSDRGRGIPEEVLARVFDRFESHTEGSRHRGVGLGLSIVRSFVELHGGNVRIETSPGNGTTVTCTFPLDGGGAKRIAAE